MFDIIFLKPVFHQKIWGGNKLSTVFGYDIPSEKTGESWVISAHLKGDCEVLNPECRDYTLSKLWKEMPHIFGKVSLKEFPLLVKMIDANDDLSIQVHPNDEWAKVIENEENGKTECWLILDCKEKGKIVYGHRAKKKDEFNKMIDDHEWEKILAYKEIKKGDFFYVPAGTIHAICKGALIYEVQQSSDITYRLYDYDRVDDKGNPRELHIKQCKNVVTIPHKNIVNKINVQEVDGTHIITYISNTYFTVKKLSIKSQYTWIHNQPFILCTVINGEGLINSKDIKIGDNFVITSKCKRICIEGEIEMIISYV